MPMDAGDRADVEWLLKQIDEQATAEAVRNDDVLTRQEKHAAVSVGMAATLKAFDSDAAELAAALGNPTLPSPSEAS